MPFIPHAIIVAVAVIAKVTAVVVSAAASTLAAVGVPLAIAKTAALIAVPFIFQTGATMLLTAGITALTSPKIHASGSPSQWRADPNAGIPYAMGRIGLAGNIVAELTSYGDKNKFLHFITVLSGAGPIESFESFKANDTDLTISGGAVTSSPYAGKMWITTQLGATTDVALAAPSGTGAVPEWDSDHKMTGYAAVRMALEYDPNVYPTGVPKPITVIKGVTVYDPRLDSTYPGGSGSHRYDDESTWEWSDNPWLHALTFCIGRYSNSKKIIGLGAPEDSVDVSAFVDAANVAETNGWTIAGVISSKDDKWQALGAMAQAGGGSIVRLGGQISCVIATPRASIATVTGDDIVSGVQIPGTQARRARINSVVYRYLSESHGWEMVPADKVSIAAYVTTDGDYRTRPVDFPCVSDVHQGAQLAAYGIMDSRELAPIVLPLKPSFSGLKAGDVITVDEPELGLNSQALFIVARERDPKTGVVTLTCRTETTAKHAYALALTGTAPPTPSLTAVELYSIAAPGAGAWSAEGVTFTGGGTSIPAIVVTGAADNPTASETIVEFKPHAGSSWAVAAIGPASSTNRVEITGLTPATLYDVRISYRVRGVLGASLELTSITSGTFSGSGAVADYTPDAIAWADISVSSSSPAQATTTTETFTGIDTTLTLDISWTGAGTGEYQKNGGAWTALSSGDDITVGVGDTLAFRMTRTGSAGTSSGTVTVTNVTAGSPTTVLDSFAYSCVVVSGVTPDAVDWANLRESNSWTDANVTFSGLSSSITLRLEWDDTGDDPATVQYRKNSGSYVTFADGDTLSIANGDTLNFKMSSGGPNSFGSISVINESDADAVLDVLNYVVITFV